MLPGGREGTNAMHLVTGGAGFIGSHLVHRLLADGHRVRVFDNFSGGSRERLAAIRGDIDLVEGDLRDEAAVARAVRDVEVIFHEAAEPSVPRSVADPATTYAVNVSGTLNLLQAAAAAGCRRLVFASTCAVYGDAPPPTAETSPPRPFSPYASSKLAGEDLNAVFTHLHGLETVTLRYFNVYGPGQDPASAYAAAIPRFAAVLAAGEPLTIFGDGEQTRDFVSVHDIVAANLLAATTAGASGETINVGSGRATSILEVIALLQRVLGTNLPVRHEPPRAGDIRHSLADIGRAREVLGFEPAVPFADGLERLVASGG